MEIKEFLSHLDGVKSHDGQYTAKCPCKAHANGDRHPSLSISVGNDGRILLHCHAGCATEDIVAALGLTMKDLFLESTAMLSTYTPKPRTAASFEAEHLYYGNNALPVLKKIKMRESDGGKIFYWERLEEGKWLKGRNGIDTPLYTTTAGGPLANGVFLVEGEKDVDTLKGLGKCAVSLPDGAASKWRPEYKKALEGHMVVIIQDNDQPGKDFAQRVAEELQGSASSIKVIDLTKAWAELPEHGDTTDLIQHMGGEAGVLEILQLAQDTPEWGPPSPLDNIPCLKVVTASDVAYEPPRWTIAPYIQRGKGTLIQADPGVGKTAFVCAIAAHVTTGLPLLGLPIDTTGDVLILTMEDDLPVLRGRIEACGGNLSKCHFVTETAGVSFSSPSVEATIRKYNARVVIFDPLQAFLGAKIDMHRANETRPELAKLFEMCARQDCACIIIAHTSKSIGDKSPVNRALGSVDIPAAMRSVIQIIENPENEDERVAIHVKCSNAAKGRSIVYSIGDRGGVEWKSFSSMTAADLVVIAKQKEKKGIPYEYEPLVQVLNQLITDKPGGGFWSYADLASEGTRVLGFPPFADVPDLKARLEGGLANELQKRDGLLVTCGAVAKGNVRGIRIVQYQTPNAYQTKMSMP